MHTDNTPHHTAVQQKNLTSSGGTVVAFDRSNRPEEKEEYTAAIRMWCVDRSLSNALTKEEIGAMRGFDRVDAQRKALLLNLSHYYRTHKQADVAPGVAAAIHLMSDNDKGTAQVSQQTLAEFFGRSRSSIAEAYDRLRKDEIIVTGRGRYAAPYPVIPRAVTTGYNHLAWMVSAVCAPEAKVNCPAGQDNCQLSGGALQLNQSSGEPLRLEAVNCPASDPSIVRRAATPIHYDTSLEETTLERVRESRSISKAVAIGIGMAAGTLPLAAAPAEPPAIVRPAAQLHDLANKLHEAGGAALNLTKPLMHVVEVPRNWIAAGCDLELDILPMMRAMTARKEPCSIGTWKYFEGAIMDAKAARTAPIAERRTPTERMAPWEEKELRVYNEGTQAMERLRAKYALEEEQGIG